MSRLDQYELSVSLDYAGVHTDLGTWDKQSGGNIDSAETRYKPGGMAPEISLGGSQTVTAITVQRLFKLDRDLALVPKLKAAVGRGLITVSRQPLDVDGAAYGKPIVWSGTLKQLMFPDPDSESSNAGLIQLEVSPGGTVTAG